MTDGPREIVRKLKLKSLSDEKRDFAAECRGIEIKRKHWLTLIRHAREVVDRSARLTLLERFALFLFVCVKRRKQKGRNTKPSLPHDGKEEQE